MHGEVVTLDIVVGCLVREWELQCRLFLRLCMVQYWYCAWRWEIEDGGYGPARSTERCDVGVSLRPYLGCRLKDKLGDLIRCSPHALNPREVMSTCCQMCRLVDRGNGRFVCCQDLRPFDR